MIKDTGTILLTDKDLEEYREGFVSKRIQELWGISFEQLKEIIQHNNYKVINDGSKIGRTEEDSGTTSGEVKG